MAMSRSLRNQKKIMLLIVGPRFDFRRRKRTIKTTTATVKREGCCSNCCAEDVRKLCNQGLLKEALNILYAMDQSLGTFTYVCLLQVCIKKEALSEGKMIQAHMIERGFIPDTFSGSALVNLYTKCGSLVDARTVFDDLPKQSSFSWNVIIAAYSRNGLAEDALKLFHQMQQTDIHPDQFTFASVLPACAKLAALEQGTQIHEYLIRSGIQSDVFVENALVDMYAKCRSMEKARVIFDKMHQRDVVSWTSMIAGYIQNGQDVEAIMLFQQMQLAGVKPDSRTFAIVLPACANLAALEKGMEIHEEMIRSGFESHVFVENALVDMYAKCRSLENARKLFDKMPQRSVVSWNAMIAGYAQAGYVEEALKFFREMSERDVISWTVMIAGYAQNGQGVEALNFFRQMLLAGVKPYSNTFASALQACANSASLKEGAEIHKEIIKTGCQSNVFVQSALVGMYAKCGSLEKARHVFDKMHQRNVVSWTAMLSGYVQNGQSVEALKVFQQMQLAGVKPDLNTFASVFTACANLGALEQGMEIHEDIIKSGFVFDVFVENALVDMYAKCGSIDKARDVFDKMRQRSVISWTAMIAGYAMHGCGKEALKLFEQMQISGIKPNHITIVCVLSACCHAGLVNEGRQLFQCMTQNYDIPPATKHYACMVDLLGRAGHLDEARDFINKMPIEPDAFVWSCLLGACRVHNNIELGEFVAERLFELDPKNAAPYVLLSNIYAAAGRWNDSEKVWKLMKGRGVTKMPGCSWIEVNKQVHAFLARDGSNPQAKKINEKLEVIQNLCMQ
eukprot:Gb_16986 [translate_table: standard]